MSIFVTGSVSYNKTITSTVFVSQNTQQQQQQKRAFSLLLQLQREVGAQLFAFLSSTARHASGERTFCRRMPTLSGVAQVLFFECLAYSVAITMYLFCTRSATSMGMQSPISIFNATKHEARRKLFNVQVFRGKYAR